MKKSITIMFISLFITIFLLASCTPKSELNTITTSTSSSTSTTISSPDLKNQDLKIINTELNTEFELKINQTANIESENIKIKFLDILEDSRCPSDVQCVWQGQARVLVNVEKNGQDLGDFILIDLADKEDLRIKDFNGYTIKLLKVMPYPKINEKVETDTTIRLIVEKGKINEIELIEIITDRDVYTQYGNDVEIKVKNNGLNPVTLTANNGCAQFFQIINLKTGKSILLYDKNLICTQAIKESTINPGETKTIGYWDKINYDTSECPDTSICKRSKVNLGKYKIVVKDQSKIIDIIVYTY